MGNQMTIRTERPHTVRVGSIEITSVSDGTLDAKLETIQRLDPVEARRRIDAAAKTHGVDPLVLPVRAFLVRSPNWLALVDTGSGTTKGPSMGHLPAALAAAGVDPDTIGHVVLTHLHMDHIGGLIDQKGRALFPNAELVLHRKEAEFFLETPIERLDERSARNVAFQRIALAAYGARVRRVDDGQGLPGLSARLAPGHTPGHTAWQVESEGQSAIVLGDVVHLAAIQLPLPATPMIYDVDPDLAGRTRIALLDEVAGRPTLVAGAHLPAPGLGRIVRAGSGFDFEPVSPAS